MSKLLRRTQFGNPILRSVARILSVDEILGDDIQQLINDMRRTVAERQYGVGLAAPQVGQGVALSVIAIKKTPSRPDALEAQMVIINPVITEVMGKRSRMWEGCISFGGAKDFPYAQTLRYKSIRLKYQDEHAIEHEEVFDGLLAHVLQHEVDHLHGVLFVDRVDDPKSYMMVSEYKKRLKAGTL